MPSPARHSDWVVPQQALIPRPLVPRRAKIARLSPALGSVYSDLERTGQRNTEKYPCCALRSGGIFHFDTKNTYYDCIFRVSCQVLSRGVKKLRKTYGFVCFSEPFGEGLTRSLYFVCQIDYGKPKTVQYAQNSRKRHLKPF